jgi:hypothetical protein
MWYWTHQVGGLLLAPLQRRVELLECLPACGRAYGFTTFQGLFYSTKWLPSNHLQ